MVALPPKVQNEFKVLFTQSQTEEEKVKKVICVLNGARQTNAGGAYILLIMDKIVFWNVRGLNIAQKQQMLRDFLE